MSIRGSTSGRAPSPDRAFGRAGQARGGARAWSTAGVLLVFVAGSALSFQVACGPPFTDGAGGSGAGGAGGGTPVECVPGENAAPVANECGVFVGGALGLDDNPGTKEAPFATLARAIEMAAETGRIYACAQDFPEAIGVPANTEIYGGLDCASFAHVAGQKTNIVPAADLVPVTLLGGAGVRIEGVLARAADAAAPGGSSIAMVAREGAAAALVDSELHAGVGAVGAQGAGKSMRATDGEQGNPGEVGCATDGSVPGAPAKVNAECPASIGGPGGAGDVTLGLPGGVGQPGNAPGGMGQVVGAACTAGQLGGIGDNGMGGPGATGLGLLSDAGYAGPPGSAGLTPGTPGKGGGGGGGARGASVCIMTDKAGPSGGSGASGGCGGAVGDGGGPGGSSIGLLSHKAAMTLDRVLIVTSTGGAGGIGGKGQNGGFGGSTGGSASGGACSGGAGGTGGRGGSGGGGLGGHSIGIAFTGIAPMSTDFMFTGGGVGVGGVGGEGNVGESAKGEPGKACKTLNFEEPDTCSP